MDGDSGDWNGDYVGDNTKMLISIQCQFIFRDSAKIVLSYSLETEMCMLTSLCFYPVHADRSETDIVNVVEQRIWRSMEEGHFENLPGKGKPLDLNTNPHADPAEYTLYRILFKNGCAPEWVELNKEIRCRIAEWRLALKKAWTSRINHQGSTWPKDSLSLKAEMHDINNKVMNYLYSIYIKDLIKQYKFLCSFPLDLYATVQVLRYNLIVPFGRQMCGLKWDKEITKLE